MNTPAKSTGTRRNPRTVEILQLRIDLAYVEPTVTRTILIRANAKLSTLHIAIQCAMGWHNSHLHELEKDGVRYGEDDPFGIIDEPSRQSENEQTGTLLKRDGDTMMYLYDFGDSWHHTITREAELPRDQSLRRPQCIAGENACPPEDVGGPPGYMQYLEAVLDVNHPEHEEMVEWNGPDFHPGHFSVEAANDCLKRNFR